MQNCLGELNLIYCLIYLDDIVVFSHTAEEHLHQHYTLFLTDLESTIYNQSHWSATFSGKRSPIWHIEPQRMECNPIIQTWRPLQSEHCLKTYTQVHAFLGLDGHYRRFIKGFTCIAQPLNKHLAREGASRKSEWVSLSEDSLKDYEALKHMCTTVPVLAFADYTKPFLLQTDASKDGLGAVLSQKQADRWYHPVTYGSRGLMPHEKNYHWTKLEFLALKWAVTDCFKEYLPYQPFLVKTDNNPLTYIMMTPNLNATGHQWVSALAWFNFGLEYQKGHDNNVADA